MLQKFWEESKWSVQHWAALFGELDAHAKKIEQDLGVRMVLRDGFLLLEGEEGEIRRAKDVLQSMSQVIERQGYITQAELQYLLDMANQKEVTDGQMDSLYKDVIVTTAHGKPIRAKTLGQRRYVDAIEKNGFTFGIGPAGTGKTYLAMSMAIKAFKAHKIHRIILTRPAVEAGESLGFLPGDLQEKIDPYLRPLYDAIYEILGPDNYMKMKEKGQIEVAPLAYMRGRTLDNSFIVLDEAQNTTPQQMKMFLTRLGYGSKAVITGDITQVDLPHGKKSGLKVIQNILQDVEGVSFCYFNRSDVVRHPLVQRVIDAFERYETEKEALATKESSR